MRASSQVELSTPEATRFVFREPPVHIEHDVTRAQFDGWIAEEISSMAACVDRLLARAGVAARDVDRVFMRGGTSFVPAVRALLDARFDAVPGPFPWRYAKELKGACAPIPREGRVRSRADAWEEDLQLVARSTGLAAQVRGRDRDESVRRAEGLHVEDPPFREDLLTERE
jgi:hypothetical protein